ncbi:ctenidin-1 [Drosophila subpulchrella]|uniref:ctenidin-1 n=1 Tax=Drosophila subpulchrella TaxID=1486046 RepID=UPI0018A1A980|nr:ctenidin-1 [Drosophila subpulchrella]
MKFFALCAFLLIALAAVQATPGQVGGHGGGQIGHGGHGGQIGLGGHGGSIGRGGQSGHGGVGGSLGHGGHLG